MLTVVLFCAFAPAVFAGILLLATGALKSDARLWWTMPLAIVIGFAIAQYGTDGVPTFPPVQASDYFTPIALVVGVLAIAFADRLPGLARLALRVVVSLAIILVIVQPVLGPTWTPSQATGWIAGMLVVAVITWTSLESTSKVAPGPGLPIALLVNAAGVAVVLVSAGSARYAQLAGAVASVMGPVAVLGFIRRESPLLKNSGWVAGVLLSMLLVAGVTFVDVPLPSALLVALAPVTFRVGELKALQNRPWWQRELARVVVSLVLVAIAAVLSMPKPNEYDY